MQIASTDFIIATITHFLWLLKQFIQLCRNVFYAVTHGTRLSYDDAFWTEPAEIWFEGKQLFNADGIGQYNMHSNRTAAIQQFTSITCYVRPNGSGAPSVNLRPIKLSIPQKYWRIGNRLLTRDHVRYLLSFHMNTSYDVYYVIEIETRTRQTIELDNFHCVLITGPLSNTIKCIYDISSDT